MKKLDRIFGFINYSDIEFPFEFNEKIFTLQLYPPTKDIWKVYSDPMRIFDSVRNGPRIHKWISETEIKGITSDGYNIIFNVNDDLSNSNGFLSLDVKWYMFYSDWLHVDRINGFRILGNDVNYFYPPHSVFEPKLEFSDDGRYLNKISVSSKVQEYDSCGKYRISKNVDANIEMTAIPSYHSENWINPIEAVSCMITTFSVPVGIDTIIKAYYNLRYFFEYITYRKNVDIGDIDLFFKNEEGLRDYSGKIVFKRKYLKEINKDEKKRIIPYNLLKKQCSRIFTAINNKVLGFQHICNSIDDMRYFPSSRIIMILAEFEREYRNVYRQDCRRSDGYLEIKEEVVSLIDGYLKTKHGLNRVYGKELKKYIKNRDSSFETNMRNALIDHEEILTPFITHNYSGIYLGDINAISSRMGVIRNGIAHSRLDLKFDAIHLSDIRVIEELIYAIRLKKIYMSTSDCKRAINKLFGEGIQFL